MGMFQHDVSNFENWEGLKQQLASSTLPSQSPENIRIFLNCDYLEQIIEHKAYDLYNNCYRPAIAAGQNPEGVTEDDYLSQIKKEMLECIWQRSYINHENFNDTLQPLPCLVDIAQDVRVAVQDIADALEQGIDITQQLPSEPIIYEESFQPPRNPQTKKRKRIENHDQPHKHPRTYVNHQR